jgi:hypothetical protein
MPNYSRHSSHLLGLDRGVSRSVIDQLFFLMGDFYIGYIGHLYSRAKFGGRICEIIPDLLLIENLSQDSSTGQG